MNTKEFILKLLGRNTGVSSMRWVHFICMVLVVFLLLSCCFVMVYDTLKPERLSFDFFTGIAEVILACSALLLCTGMSKAFSDKWQFNNKKSYDKV